MKTCTKCGVEYPATKEFFNGKKSGKDGLMSACKKCHYLAIKKWAAENPQKVKAAKGKWEAKNPEKVKAKNKKYYAENPEKVKAAKGKWEAKNPEKVKAATKKYCAENAEKIRAATKKWAAKNPEKVSYSIQKNRLKKQIGETPPPELVEIKVLINKTKRLCKTLKN